ncbi:hypothetical protein DAERI_090215 [Deinococcus aerius]|uniref:Uncharacterized protein n=2 Tax=Deinococcus aerius TaxID=200253 RepID=A0A2I9CX33_9DEIO|nr:hypothetical protein DAERI_090215 [Deinococcus aerius]
MTREQMREAAHSPTLGRVRATPSAIRRTPAAPPHRCPRGVPGRTMGAAGKQECRAAERKETMNHQMQLDLSRDRAQALRAEAHRDREARRARPERPAARPLEALLSALHLRPRVRPA